MFGALGRNRLTNENLIGGCGHEGRSSANSGITMNGRHYLIGVGDPSEWPRSGLRCFFIFANFRSAKPAGHQLGVLLRQDRGQVVGIKILERWCRLKKSCCNRIEHQAAPSGKVSI
jgi:hypothetical protein